MSIRRGDTLKLRLSAVGWFLLGAGFLLSLPVPLGISILFVQGGVVAALLPCADGACNAR